MKNKVCCIFNLAPHYRKPIYTLMDEELECDFYLGDTLDNQIALMDYNSLNGYKKTLKNKKLTKTGFSWQFGVWYLIFKPYKQYIITGSPSILSNWVLAILAKILRKKVYAWTHGMKKPTQSKGDLFAKVYYQLFHKIFLYGNYSRTIMLKEGFAEKRLITIYNSLDHQKQKQIRKSLKNTDIYTKYFKNEDPVIIYTGRLQKSKKLNLLVLALKKLQKKGINCNLVFVGLEMNDSGITDLVITNQLQNRVLFYGPCYDEYKIGELFHNATVCVSPGPVGLTALHSLTFGCPVISNDDFSNQMPEFEVIEPQRTGDFFVNDNLNSLTEKISHWIQYPKEKRQNIKNHAYDVVDKKWNPNNQIEILKEQLNTVK